MLLSVFFLLSIFGADHDIRLAKFRITEQSDGYAISINVDRADFLSTIYASKKYEEDVLGQAEKYVKSHLYYLFDGDTIDYNLQNISYSETNIFMDGKILVTNKGVQEIFVGNTCLIDQIEGHLNIMEFFLNDKERFFRLDEHRLTTTIKYN